MPPAETAGAKIRANCGSQRFASPVLLDIHRCSRQTSLPKRVLPPSVSFTSLSPSPPPPPFLRSLALNVRYRAVRDAPTPQLFSPASVLSQRAVSRS